MLWQRDQLTNPKLFPDDKRRRGEVGRHRSFPGIADLREKAITIHVKLVAFARKRPLLAVAAQKKVDFRVRIQQKSG